MAIHNTFTSDEPKAGRAATEVEIQLDQVELATQRLLQVLNKFGGHLTSSGVLLCPKPEETTKCVDDTAPGSELGNRIRGIRADLNGIASDFERLLDRLAV